MDTDTIREKVQELSPWRHSINLNGIDTFEAGTPIGPYAGLGHPEPRYQFGRLFMPDPPASVLDVGCNAGGVAFRAEADGYGPVIGIDSGDDPGLRVPNPDLFDPETDATRGVWSRARPLDQAAFCKDVRDSAVEFVEADVVAADLPALVAADVVLAYGILYHVHTAAPDRDRRTVEEDFLDDLLATATTRVVIETALERDGYAYDWVADYLADEARVQFVAGPGVDVPAGVRHVVVADPPPR